MFRVINYDDTKVAEGQLSADDAVEQLTAFLEKNDRADTKASRTVSVRQDFDSFLGSVRSQINAVRKEKKELPMDHASVLRQIGNNPETVSLSTLYKLGDKLANRMYISSRLDTPVIWALVDRLSVDYIERNKYVSFDDFAPAQVAADVLASVGIGANA